MLRRLMWKANKPFIIMLLVGMLLLAGAYLYWLPSDPLMAERIAGTGFCVLLFVVALLTYLSVRKDL